MGDQIFTIWLHSPDLLCRCCWSPGNLWCCGWGSLFPGSVADGGGLACWVPQDSDSLRLWHCTLSAHCHLETKINHVLDCWDVEMSFSPRLRYVDMHPLFPVAPSRSAHYVYIIIKRSRFLEELIFISGILLTNTSCLIEATNRTGYRRRLRIRWWHYQPRILSGRGAGQKDFKSKRSVWVMNSN